MRRRLAIHLCAARRGRSVCRSVRLRRPSRRAPCVRRTQIRRRRATRWYVRRLHRGGDDNSASQEDDRRLAGGGMSAGCTATTSDDREACLASSWVCRRTAGRRPTLQSTPAASAAAAAGAAAQLLCSHSVTQLQTRTRTRTTDDYFTRGLPQSAPASSAPSVIYSPQTAAHRVQTSASFNHFHCRPTLLLFCRVVYGYLISYLCATYIMFAE